MQRGIQQDVQQGIRQGEVAILLRLMKRKFGPFDRNRPGADRISRFRNAVEVAGENFVGKQHRRDLAIKR